MTDLTKMTTKELKRYVSENRNKDQEFSEALTELLNREQNPVIYSRDMPLEEQEKILKEKISKSQFNGVQNQMNWNQIEFSNHQIYWQIAKDNLNSSKENNTSLNQEYGVNSDSNPNTEIQGDISDVARINYLRGEINKSNIITVIFSALTAESFINYYALNNGKSKGYLRSFKDNQNLSETVRKWIDIPSDILNEYAVIENSQEANALQALFTNRNKLAHHKANIQNIQNIDWNNIQDPNSIQLQDAIDSHNAVENAIKALKKIDNNIDITWL